jgi:hypothetical protein
MYTDRYKIAIEGHLDTHLETINSSKDFISIGSSLEAFNLYKFSDTMSIIPAPIQSGAGATLSRFIGRIPSPVGIGSTYITDSRIGGELTNLKAIHEYRDSVAKAMLISILDGDSKRTTTIGVGSTVSKVSVFFNCLKKVGIGTTDSDLTFRDYSSKPWNNWNDSVGVCTPTSVSRSNNVAIVTTTPAHGLSTSYDDWGVIMNLNTGIATSFNISTSSYPNGVPVTIIDASTFSYNNVGINTPTTAVVGIASIQVGWGGTSNDLHVYLT